MSDDPLTVGLVMAGVLSFLVGVPYLITRAEANYDRPRYCRTCGKAMVDRTDMTGYDHRTGKPVFVTEPTCPNSRMRGYPCVPPYGGVRA